jgi:4-diphosphocytidyl-2-C-methyl-D-erythritol kinase
MASITVRAFAKVNLSLRFTGVARPDGFHDLRTILQSIDLFDRVVCRSRRGPFAIRCDMEGVPTDPANLVWKAARLLWDRAGWTGEPRNTIVSLQKRIPMQASAAAVAMPRPPCWPFAGYGSSACPTKICI